MEFKLKERSRFICGTTSFELSAGATVRVVQENIKGSQVLIKFGERLIEWYDISILKFFEKQGTQS